MIIVRSPLRITLGGGGTDLPSYARQFGGCCLTAAIDQYVYVAAIRPFEPGIFLKYSEQERVTEVDAVKHPIIREALRLGLATAQIELTALADIPAGTGLGSSSSFTAALVQALSLQQDRRSLSPREIAERACAIEIQLLGEPIGGQDAYAAAYGGLLAMEFNLDGTVDVRPLPVAPETLAELEDGLVLFFTGYTRQASSILRDQDRRTVQHDDRMIAQLHEVKLNGLESFTALRDGDLRRFGTLLHEHWTAKRQRSPGMTTDQIDGWYAAAMTAGALGGKLVGAGGGGCLLFYAEDPTRLRRALRGSGLQEVRFRFDHEGTKAVFA